MYTQLNQYHVVMEVAPAVLAEPRRPARHLRPHVERRRWCRSSAFARYRAATTAARGQPPGPVPVGHDLVQPDARRRARRRRRRRSSRPSARSGMPATIRGSFQGTAQAFQDSLANQPMPDRCGARRRLHRARDSLRELHPPDHDPLDAALGGRGRAARADALPAPTRRHRAHRHHPADRHREEERDHDDRLRARGGARRGQAPERRDLPGLPAALPADH